jgi:hypothetical protein
LTLCLFLQKDVLGSFRCQGFALITIFYDFCLLTGNHTFYDIR